MKAGLRENIAGLRPIRGLLTAVTVSRSAVMLFPFYGVYLATDRHELTVGTIGLIVGMFGIGSLVGDFASGALAARMPEKRVAIVGFLGVAATVLAISVSTELWTLVALTAIWGFCYELVNPIAYTMVSRAMPEEHRRFAFAAVRLAINAGMGIGPLIAGILFKVNPELLPWGTAIGYLASAFILARARIVSISQPDDEDTSATVGDDGAPARHGLRFWTFAAATTPIHFAYALPTTVGSVYVIHTLDQPAGWVSAIFAVNSFMVITVEIALNHAMLGLSRRSTLLIGYACATAGFVFMGFAPAATWLLLAATAVWTLGEMIIYPVMPDHISAISPNRLKARNMGFYTAHYNLGVVFAPLVFLPLLDELGAVASWSLVGGLLLAGLLTTAVISNSTRTWGVDRPRQVPALVEA
ncbi:MFS transporter [Actinophytocola oryzae]|uniref:Putative MFS family arabinose efflux permease n=1 Tax=Actinophytocola oryzae TaxID=502181 RepID=A0A4R7V0N5_9PSEU|nr:MFS transporter [Actinophytocola oryzae]TDV40956.1 putative MFS family arabinose efflux permease [Actinophytocola oryzae]